MRTLNPFKICFTARPIMAIAMLHKDDNPRTCLSPTHSHTPNTGSYDIKGAAL